MTPLLNDLRDFIRLLNTKNVKYVIVGAWALACVPITLFSLDGRLTGSISLRE
jgi:hypothetical protein